MLGVKPVTVFLAPPVPIGHHLVALRLACQVIYTKGPGHLDLLSAFSWVSFACEQRPSKPNEGWQRYVL